LTRLRGLIVFGETLISDDELKSLNLAYILRESGKPSLGINRNIFRSFVLYLVNYLETDNGDLSKEEADYKEAWWMD
jgi:hypothetical protein